MAPSVRLAATIMVQATSTQFMGAQGGQAPLEIATGRATSATHSTVKPDALIIKRQRSVSSEMIDANARGVVPVACTPNAARASRTAGSLSTCATADAMASMVADGVAAGANKPVQPTISIA